MKIKYFSFVILLFSLFACAKVDKLDDYNSAVSFTITEYKAAGSGLITLGDVVMGKGTADGDIWITVTEGIENFPLMFKGGPEFESHIDRVTGIDFSDWVTIDYQRDDKTGEPIMTGGRYTFDDDALKFYVQAESGLPKMYTIKIDYEATGTGNDYEDYWAFESWVDDNTPAPKGTKESPYWASANMTGIVSILNTTKTEGAPGEGSAVMLETINAVIKTASGSLFLGWFDTSNPLAGLSDPVKLTFQGMPYASEKKIKGMEADILYSPGADAGSDTGSLAIELIKWRNTSGDFVYHGRRPDGDWHPDNNADMVARGRVLVGTQAGTQNGEEIRVVPDGEWVKQVFVPLEYSGDYPQYTHLGITFASSSQGDSFIAEVGTMMKVDNVRLVYEE